jgi:secreted PhoX family phosphatase
MNRLDRRSFLRRGALVAGSSVLVGPAFQALASRGALAAEGPLSRFASHAAGGYGPLMRKKPKAVDTEFPNAADIEWLALPEGFEYMVFGVAVDTMSDGNLTPIAHDGMAAFAAPGGKVRLVRNHENRDAGGVPIGGLTNAYDPNAAGGCTTLELDFAADDTPVLVQDFVSLNGTIVNCAGGLTPAGSWVSSEETTETRGGVKHGYNFEVPSAVGSAVAPVPLTAMGRFSHEAVAVDPVSGIVYQTEDAGDSGFFRFVPSNPANLAAAGVLEMLKVKGVNGADLRTGQQIGRALPVEWVTIDDPDPAAGGLKDVYNQGFAKGGAVFRRLEGCWYGNGAISFNSTDGGDAGQGQIWDYKPAGKSDGFLQLVYESPGGAVLSFPDNIVVTPRGGLLLCEDHSFNRPTDPFAPLTNESGSAATRVHYLKGLTRDGRIFDFAAQLLDNREWAGATFSPNGQYLFVNTQGTTSAFNPATPSHYGRTYAIWGPWASGAL